MQSLFIFKFIGYTVFSSCATNNEQYIEPKFHDEDGNYNSFLSHETACISYGVQVESVQQEYTEAQNADHGNFINFDEIFNYDYLKDIPQEAFNSQLQSHEITDYLPHIDFYNSRSSSDVYVLNTSTYSEQYSEPMSIDGFNDYDYFTPEYNNFGIFEGQMPPLNNTWATSSQYTSQYDYIIPLGASEASTTSTDNRNIQQYYHSFNDKAPMINAEEYGCNLSSTSFNETNQSSSNFHEDKPVKHLKENMNDNRLPTQYVENNPYFNLSHQENAVLVTNKSNPDSKKPERTYNLQPSFHVSSPVSKIRYIHAEYACEELNSSTHDNFKYDIQEFDDCLQPSQNCNHFPTKMLKNDLTDRTSTNKLEKDNKEVIGTRFDALLNFTDESNRFIDSNGSNNTFIPGEHTFKTGISVNKKMREIIRKNSEELIDFLEKVLQKSQHINDWRRPITDNLRSQLLNPEFKDKIAQFTTEKIPKILYDSDGKRVKRYFTGRNILYIHHLVGSLFKYNSDLINSNNIFSIVFKDSIESYNFVENFFLSKIVDKNILRKNKKRFLRISKKLQGSNKFSKKNIQLFKFESLNRDIVKFMGTLKRNQKMQPIQDYHLKKPFQYRALNQIMLEDIKNEVDKIFVLCNKKAIEMKSITDSAIFKLFIYRLSKAIGFIYKIILASDCEEINLSEEMIVELSKTKANNLLLFFNILDKKFMIDIYRNISHSMDTNLIFLNQVKIDIDKYYNESVQASCEIFFSQINEGVLGKKTLSHVINTLHKYQKYILRNHKFYQLLSVYTEYMTSTTKKITDIYLS